MKKLLSITALGSLLTAVVLAVAPAWAESVDEKITAMEQELTRLKGEQIELKKEAVAAAAALPEFSYRAGRGMNIAAADKSWSFNIGWRHDTFMYNHPDGKPVIRTTSSARDRTGMTSGQLIVRRNRPAFTFCWADCFYEYELSMDMGEGIDENGANARDDILSFHFEKLNPYLPRLEFGTRIGGNVYIGRSSTSGFKSEHNLLIAGNSTTSTGSSSGMALWWEEIPVATGDVTFHARYTDRGIGTVLSDSRDTNRKAASLGLHTRPFRELKNQWLRGMEFMVGTYLQPIDDRGNSLSTNNEPDRLRIRSNDRNGRVTLFDANNIGAGLHHMVGPSGRWVVGPYQLRWAYLADKWAGEKDSFKGVGGRGWEIENGFWLWSPKGMLTGSSSTAGSLQVGWTFERVDVWCGVGCDASPGNGSFNSNTVKNRELSVWYWIRPALRTGLWWSLQEADNTPSKTQVAIGCKKDFTSAEAGKGAGRSCEWSSVNLGLQYRF